MKNGFAFFTPLTRRWRGMSRRRRGAIFVTTLGVIVILSGLLLAFAQDMRTEVIAAGNRASQIQADAIELAGEKYVMAMIDYYNSTAPVTNAAGSSVTDSWSLVYNTPAQAVQVGNGYFWIIRPNEQSDTEYDYGIVDECSKLNLNVASFNANMLLQLPTGITQDVADAVIDWKTPAAQGSQDGAQTDYYNGLAIPYEAKNQPYETVDEMMLVRGIGVNELYGLDANHDGIVDDGERAASSNSNSTSGGVSASADTRGIARYLTVWSQGEIMVQPITTGGTAGAGRGGATAGRAGGGGGGGTTTSVASGLINVNTASENVFIALGLTQSEANSLVTAAQGQSGGLIQQSDIQTAMGGSVPSSFYNQVTTSSYQYSADIVAVSGDGRAYKRVKIIIDCSPKAEAGSTGSSGSASPLSGSSANGVASTASASAVPSCVMVYRRDLSNFGWPLPQDIRTALRSGQPIEPGVPGSNLQDNGRQ